MLCGVRSPLSPERVIKIPSLCYLFVELINFFNLNSFYMRRFSKKTQLLLDRIFNNVARYALLLMPYKNVCVLGVSGKHYEIILCEALAENSDRRRDNKDEIQQ